MKDTISLQKILSGASLVVILLVASLPARAAEEGDGPILRAQQRGPVRDGKFNGRGGVASPHNKRSEDPVKKYMNMLQAYAANELDMKEFSQDVNRKAKKGILDSVVTRY